MKIAFAYIRVSTHKQGFDGASLPEQRDSIERYAARCGLHIQRWFEEEETAAKRGRKLFTEMMKLAKAGKASALIFHKIDRSTRNLAEWAEVSSLPEQGVEVHYSHEPVDLKSSHGRTAADVAAVFAASYIRNLREETKKGLYGRLKQGFYPWPAPIGYLNNGRAQLKTIDPRLGPFVRELFERYATGDWSYARLLKDLKDRGLSGSGSMPVSKHGLATILRNPFYAGLLTIKRSEQVFEGRHEPLISMRLFEKVQALLDGKAVPKTTRNEYLFQKLIRCSACQRLLIGERQRGLVYYRCHECRGVCVRETALEESLAASMSNFSVTDEERVAAKREIMSRSATLHDNSQKSRQAHTLQLTTIKNRIDRLTDSYIDGALTRNEYDERKLSLMKEKCKIEEKLNDFQDTEIQISTLVSKKLEHVFALSDMYFSGNRLEKRQLLKIATSNMQISQKNLSVQWEEPFLSLINREGVSNCYPAGSAPRRRPNPTFASEATSHLSEKVIFLVDGVINAICKDIGIETPPSPPPAPSHKRAA